MTRRDPMAWMSAFQRPPMPSRAGRNRAVQPYKQYRARPGDLFTYAKGHKHRGRALLVVDSRPDGSITLKTKGNYLTDPVGNRQPETIHVPANQRHRYQYVARRIGPYNLRYQGITR